MQFYALNSKRQPVSAKEAQKHCNYFCIECGTTVRLRSGVHRQPHFYHLESFRPCVLREKGMVHLQLQDYLHQLLPINDCSLEYRFSAINRIADVAWLSRKIVFEIQCSPISAKEIHQRNHDYNSQGWTVIWILHDQRYNQKYLSPAEIALQGNPHYFTNMDANGQGIIYDQFEMIDKGMRVKRMEGLAVDLTRPMEIMGKHQRKHSLSLCGQRLSQWPIYFAGDLLDLNESDYIQSAIHIEKEFRRLAAKRMIDRFATKILHALIIQPYKVIFRYFLEKACR